MFGHLPGAVAPLDSEQVAGLLVGRLHEGLAVINTEILREPSVLCSATERARPSDNVPLEP